MTRYAIVYRDEEDHWIAEVPSLPGCVTQGDSREEAIANVKEAIALFLEDLPEERRELYREYIEPELVTIETVLE
jgi:predicted RNase H-like HicB family nuclease